MPEHSSSAEQRHSFVTAGVATRMPEATADSAGREPASFFRAASSCSSALSSKPSNVSTMLPLWLSYVAAAGAPVSSASSPCSCACSGCAEGVLCPAPISHPRRVHIPPVGYVARLWLAPPINIRLCGPHGRRQHQMAAAFYGIAAAPGNAAAHAVAEHRRWGRSSPWDHMAAACGRSPQPCAHSQRFRGNGSRTKYIE